MPRGKPIARNSRDTRKVIAHLDHEGWIRKSGKGDHVNFFMPGNPHLITIDTGEKEIDKNIYRKICKIAGWEQ